MQLPLNRERGTDVVEVCCDAAIGLESRRCHQTWRISDVWGCMAIELLLLLLLLREL